MAGRIPRQRQVEYIRKLKRELNVKLMNYIRGNIPVRDVPTGIGGQVKGYVDSFVQENNQMISGMARERLPMKDAVDILQNRLRMPNIENIRAELQSQFKKKEVKEEEPVKEEELVPGMEAQLAAEVQNIQLGGERQYQIDMIANNPQVQELLGDNNTIRNQRNIAILILALMGTYEFVRFLRADELLSRFGSWLYNTVVSGDIETPSDPVEAERIPEGGPPDDDGDDGDEPDDEPDDEPEDDEPEDEQPERIPVFPFTDNKFIQTILGIIKYMYGMPVLSYSDLKKQMTRQGLKISDKELKNYNKLGQKKYLDSFYEMIDEMFTTKDIKKLDSEKLQMFDLLIKT